MRIAVSSNRFRKDNWTNISWLPHFWDKYNFPKGCDFYCYLNDEIELLFNPEQLIKYRERDQIGTMIEDVTIHNKYPDVDIPLGFPLFYNGFVVLKNTDKSQLILDTWKELEDISLVIYKLNLIPINYPSNIIKIHQKIDVKPNIIWGKEND